MKPPVETQPPYLRPLSPVMSGEILIPTPWGPSVRVALAPLFFRAVAFQLDTLFYAFFSMTFVALLMTAGFATIEQYLLWIVAALFVSQALVLGTIEVLSGGQSLGKWLMELRVVSLDGTPLGVRNVWFRSLGRVFEMHLPFLAALPFIRGGVGEMLLAMSAATLISALVHLVPLLSARRQRLGDFIAGTVVIYAPRSTVRMHAYPPAMAAQRFPTEKLRGYGSYELQVLEALLADAPPEGSALITSAAQELSGELETGAGAVAVLEQFCAELRQDIGQQARERGTPAQNTWL